MRRIFAIWLLIIPLLLMAQTTSRFTFPLKSKTTNRLVPGKNVDLYQNGMKKYDLVETSPGIYSYDGVATGEYDIVVNGNTLADYQGYFIGAKKLATIEGHADAEGRVGVGGLQSGAVEYGNLSETVKAQLGGNHISKHAPDDSTLALKIVGADTLMRIKPSYEQSLETRWQQFAEDSTLVDLYVKGNLSAANQIEKVGLRQHALNSPVINVKDYGAVGDGITDDTMSLTNAISDLADGSVLDLAGGVYLTESQDIANLSDIIIKDGELKFKSTSSGKYILQLYNLNNVTFKKVIFDGNMDGQYWLYTYSNDEISFLKCKFKNLGNGSLSVWGNRIRSSNKIVFDNCVFDTINSSGISRALFFTDTSTPGKFNKIVKCHFNNINPSNDSDAIYAEASGIDRRIDLTIINNTFTDIAKRYIKLNADGVTVRGNKGYASALQTNMFACISAYGDDIIITNNQFFFNGSLACYHFVEMVTDHKGIKIINNIVRSGTVLASSYAIYLAGNLTDILIANNTLEKFDYGIKDAASGSESRSIKITNNEFIGFTDHIIFFTGDTYDLYIEGNRSPSSITSRYFLYLSGINQNTIVLDNKHNSSYGLSNVRLSEASGNYTGAVADYVYEQGVKIDYRSSAPISGTWELGDKVYNTAPGSASYIGWVCITSGSPGLWKGFGLIE